MDRMDPDLDGIIVLCKKELDIKYSQYGNTWLEQDDKYYKERLIKEVREYIESMTVESEKRKLLNIINIAAMAWQTAKNNRATRYVSTKCPNCVEPLSVHMVLRNVFVCK